MPPAARTVDQFVELLQRFIRLRPKLAFPNEHVAGLKQQMRDLHKGLDANPGERIFLFRILDILMRNGTSPTMGELSAELEIPLSSATRLADGLVRAKFAQRCADPKDRRVVRLCLTERGRKFVEAATERIKESIGHVLTHLSTDEQAQLLRLMTKLLDSVQAGASADARPLSRAPAASQHLPPARVNARGKDQ